MQRIDLESGSQAAGSRALVVTEPATTGRRAAAAPAAPFLAQLLAVKAGLPQTRDRRRAEPDEATHSYAMTMTPRPPRAGRLLSRAM